MSFLVDREAFTLIELLVVIAIIGILAAAAIPQVMDAICKSRAGATKSSISSVRTAISQCVAEDATGSCEATQLGAGGKIDSYLPSSITDNGNWSVTGKEGNYTITNQAVGCEWAGANTGMQFNTNSGNFQGIAP